MTARVVARHSFDDGRYSQASGKAIPQLGPGDSDARATHGRVRSPGTHHARVSESHYFRLPTLDVKRASEIDALPWCVPLNGLTIKIKDGSRRMAAICEPVAFPLCFRVEAVDLFAGSVVPGNPDAVFKREPLAAYHARTRLGAVRFDFNAVRIGSRAGAAADALADFTYRYAEPAGLDVIHRLPGGYSLSVEPSAASGILYVAVSWKPIVWNRADHYAQWLSYPTRAGLTPHPGSRVTIEEHPGRGFVAAGVEAGSEPAMVWLTPIDTAVE